jgi:hypothetical protein
VTRTPSRPSPGFGAWAIGGRSRVARDDFSALFDESVRLDRTMSGAWIFQVMKRLAPRRSARMMQKWRAGVVLLERGRLQRTHPPAVAV